MRKYSNKVLPNLKDRTIIIIEDDEPSLLLLVELLEATNAKIITANSAETAIEIVKQNSIDLVLLDIQLGDISGCVLLPEIRKYAPKAYVIAQTAYAMNNDSLFFMEVGFNDYLPKPIEWVHFKAALKKFDTYISNWSVQ